MLSDQDASEIMDKFPEVEFAFAYGSGNLQRRQLLPSLNPPQLNPDLPQLNPDLSQLNPNLSQLNPNLSQLNPALSQL